MRSYFRTDVNRALLSAINHRTCAPCLPGRVTEAHRLERRDNEQASWGTHAANKLALMDEWPLLILGQCGGGSSGSVGFN